MPTTKGGKKGRKIGGAGRSPAMKRYVAEMRWEKNAKRRLVRHQKRVQKKAAKLARRATNAPRVRSVEASGAESL